MDLVEFWEREVLPQLRVEAIYEGVAWKTRGPRFWRGPCPLHGGTDANFSVHSHNLERTQSFSCKVPHRAKFRAVWDFANCLLESSAVFCSFIALWIESGACHGLLVRRRNKGIKTVKGFVDEERALEATYLGHGTLSSTNFKLSNSRFIGSSTAKPTQDVETPTDSSISAR